MLQTGRLADWQAGSTWWQQQATGPPIFGVLVCEPEGRHRRTAASLSPEIKDCPACSCQIRSEQIRCSAGPEVIHRVLNVGRVCRTCWQHSTLGIGRIGPGEQATVSAWGLVQQTRQMWYRGIGSRRLPRPVTNTVASNVVRLGLPCVSFCRRPGLIDSMWPCTRQCPNELTGMIVAGLMRWRTGGIRNLPRFSVGMGLLNLVSASAK